MRKQNVEKIVPPLPEGISITDRPAGLEFLQRGNARWIKLIQALDALDATKCVQIACDGLDKKGVNRMKVQIRHSAKKLGFDSEVRFAVQGNLLLVWSNK